MSQDSPQEPVFLAVGIIIFMILALIRYQCCRTNEGKIQDNCCSSAKNKDQKKEHCCSSVTYPGVFSWNGYQRVPDSTTADRPSSVFS